MHSIPQTNPYAANNPIIFQLSLAAGRIYQAICWFVPEGGTRQLTNCEIAERGRISEGTVSRAIWEVVELGLIDRSWDAGLNDGRGGYVITRLALPDQELIPESLGMGSGIDPNSTGSIPDPSEYCIRTPENAESIKNAYKVHESHESMSHESVSERHIPAELAFPDDPEWPQWEVLGVYPQAYVELRRNFPTVTLTQFSFWCSQLQSKRSPAGFVIYCLKQHLPLPRQRTQAPPRQAQRTHVHVPQMPAPPTADDEAQNAQAWQRVAALLPRGSDLDQAEVVTDLLDGYTENDALARLALRRPGVS